MNRSIVRLAVLLILVAFPASQSRGGSEAGVAALEEVIVRGNRRAQNLRDVPMSVSAFTRQFFRDSGVRTLDSLEAYTPSLRVQTRTLTRVSRMMLSTLST